MSDIDIFADEPLIAPVTRPASAESTTAKQSSGPSFIFGLVIAGMIGLAIFVYRSDLIGPPGPGGNVAKVTEEATRQLGINYAAVMERIAEKVEAGEITSAVQYQSLSQTYTRAGRTEAMKPIDQLDTDNLPGGDWSEKRSEVATYFRAKASGHLRASK